MAKNTWKFKFSNKTWARHNLKNLVIDNVPAYQTTCVVSAVNYCEQVTFESIRVPGRIFNLDFELFQFYDSDGKLSYQPLDFILLFLKAKKIEKKIKKK